MRATVRIYALVTAVGLGLTLVAGLLLELPHLPLQDLPNHAQVLSLARHADEAQETGLFEKPRCFLFAYKFYQAMDRIAAPWLSTETSLRLMMLLAALGLPLSAAWLARSAGGSATMAMLLSLPLALGWPYKMGLVPYLLAIPCAIALLGFALRLCRDPAHEWRWGAAISVGASVCYLAHPLVFGFALVFLGLAWLLTTPRRLRSLVALVVAMVPCAAMLAWDAAHRAFDQIPGTRVVWHGIPLGFRPLSDGFAHVITRSYGIANRAWLPYYVLLPCLLVVLIVLAWRQRQDADFKAVRWALLAAGLLLSVGTAFAPETVGVTFLLGQRMPLIGFVVLSALAACARPVRLSVLAVAIAASGLALGASAVDIARRSQRVESILAGGDLHRLSGRLVSAYVTDCPSGSGNWSWGNYHSEWHLWAYTLSTRGVSPHLFAFSRYLPIWYQSRGYVQRLAAPSDGAQHAPWLPGTIATCQRRIYNRVVRAYFHPSHFDGVIVFGQPENVAAVVSGIEMMDAHWYWITHGMAALVRDEAAARVLPDNMHPAALIGTRTLPAPVRPVEVGLPASDVGDDIERSALALPRRSGGVGRPTPAASHPVRPRQLAHHPD